MLHPSWEEQRIHGVTQWSRREQIGDLKALCYRIQESIKMEMITIEIVNGDSCYEQWTYPMSSTQIDASHHMRDWLSLTQESVWSFEF